MVALVAVAGLLVPLSVVARTVVREPEAESVLARLPLAFEANQGQFAPDVRFLARAPGQNVALTGTGLQLSSGVSLTLRGARPDVEVEGRDPLPGHVSRIVGDDPAGWTAGAPTFGSVAYGQVYPGVDLVVHGRGRDVEHDYVVAAGADPGTIEFSLDGPSATAFGPRRPHLDDGGGIVAGDTTLRAPELYQDRNGRRVPVDGAFEPRGESTFGFTVGPYDPTVPLVIDPVIVSASYLGGGSTDTAYGVVTDADGHMILTGYTESSDFQTLNPAQPGQAATEGTRTDIFVSKVRNDGSSLLWSTYIGGKGRDAALAIALGPDGSTYLTGYTESNDFPTTKPIRNTNAGGSDVFVVKLNPAGTAVDFATYVGGSGTDSGNGIAVDPNGGVYVVGTTGSPNFPTAKAFQPGLSKADDQDAFIFKVESSLTSLAWSTYMGGGGDDHATDVAVDREGNVYLTGDTKSINFPVSRPFQPAPGGSGAGAGGSFADAFVGKIKPDGSGLIFGSFIGGSDSDKGSGIAVDGEGNVFVTGNTGSANFPVVSAAQAKKDGDFDAFVLKVKADGTALAYSTYLGGSGSDGAESIVVDGAGRASLVGATASTNFPTEKPFQSAKGGGFVDAFVTSVSPAGNSFTSSS
ncbi:MAG: SBBP repeat-containing protein, partial [Acidimicrobiales bacterium]